MSAFNFKNNFFLKLRPNVVKDSNVHSMIKGSSFFGGIASVLSLLGMINDPGPVGPIVAFVFFLLMALSPFLVNVQDPEKMKLLQEKTHDSAAIELGLIT